MPSTDDVTAKTIEDWFHAQTGGDYPPDDACVRMLEAKGFNVLFGVLYAPTASYTLHDDDITMLRYLIEEWDYAYRRGGYKQYERDCVGRGVMPRPEV